MVRALGEDPISQGARGKRGIAKQGGVETYESNGVTGSTVLLVNRMGKDVGCWSLLIVSAQETN